MPPIPTVEPLATSGTGILPAIRLARLRLPAQPIRRLGDPLQSIRLLTGCRVTTRRAAKTRTETQCPVGIGFPPQGQSPWKVTQHTPGIQPVAPMSGRRRDAKPLIYQRPHRPP